MPMSAELLPLHGLRPGPPSHPDEPDQPPPVRPVPSSEVPAETATTSVGLAGLIRQYAAHVPLLSRMSHPYAQAVDATALDLAERRWLPVDTEAESDLWLISWPPDARTGWHDHGGACGAFTVLDGTLSEAVWTGRSAVVEPLRQGVSRCFGDRHVHDVVNTSGQPALSLHAYSPGLSTMTHYSLVEGPGGSRLCVAGVEVAGGHW